MSKYEKDARFPELSATNARVLGYVARGLSNKVIAHELGVVETTIKSQLSAIARYIGGYANRTTLSLWFLSRLSSEERDTFIRENAPKCR